MKTYTENQRNWKEFSFLTKKNIKKNEYLVTGYSIEPLEKGDIIWKNKAEGVYWEVKEELERHNSAGHWPKGDNINNHFKAIVLFNNHA